MSERDDALVRTRVEELGTVRTVDATITEHTFTDREVLLPLIAIGRGASETSRLEQGTELQIVSTLGEGGMGRVHLARQRSLDREVAVKTLKRGTTEAVARALLREARMTGMLEHPGVIPVHALGVDEARTPLLVMKRIDGVDLSTHIARDAPLHEAHPRLSFYVETLIQVCRTLEFAHSRGVLHRDIKPDNIMVGGFGEVYLLDWGIAITKSEAVGTEMVGTPIYMAPEMVEATVVDERTDVYLLGATLHRVLTGKPLHSGTTLAAVIRSALLPTPYDYDPSIPEELVRLCRRATAHAPEDRPESVTEVREALAAYLQHRSARGLAESALERAKALESMVTSAELDLARARRLVVEGRFALEEALRQDPDGAVAKAGLRRLLLVAVDIELRHDDVDAASALLADLDPPDVERQRRVEERREEIARREANRARLARIGAAADPTLDAKTRTIPTIVLTLSLTVVSGFAASRGPTFTAGTAVVAGVAVLVVMLGWLVVVRKRILTSGFNRRTSALLVLAIVAMIANRVSAFIGGRPPAEALRHDLLLFAVVAVAAAVTMVPRLWVCGVVLGAGYAGISFFPTQASPIFTATTLLNLAAAAVVVRRAGQAGRRDQDEATAHRRDRE